MGIGTDQSLFVVLFQLNIIMTSMGGGDTWGD